VASLIYYSRPQYFFDNKVLNTLLEVKALLENMSQKPLISQQQQEKLKKKLEVSNFEPNAILRGAQLTIVGGKVVMEGMCQDIRLTCALAHRALQNPKLFTSDHYKQAAIAVGVGIAIRLAISVPVSTYGSNHLPFGF
jgi:hypothetical protein